MSRRIIVFLLSWIFYTGQLGAREVIDNELVSITIPDGWRHEVLIYEYDASKTFTHNYFRMNAWIPNQAEVEILYGTDSTNSFQAPLQNVVWDRAPGKPSLGKELSKWGKHKGMGIEIRDADQTGLNYYSEFMIQNRYMRTHLTIKIAPDDPKMRAAVTRMVNSLTFKTPGPQEVIKLRNLNATVALGDFFKQEYDSKVDGFDFEALQLPWGKAMTFEEGRRPYRNYCYYHGGRYFLSCRDGLWVSDDALNWELYQVEGRDMYYNHNLFYLNGEYYWILYPTWVFKSRDGRNWQDVMDTSTLWLQLFLSLNGKSQVESQGLVVRGNDMFGVSKNMRNASIIKAIASAQVEGNLGYESVTYHRGFWYLSGCHVTVPDLKTEALVWKSRRGESWEIVKSLPRGNMGAYRGTFEGLSSNGQNIAAYTGNEGDIFVSDGSSDWEQTPYRLDPRVVNQYQRSPIWTVGDYFVFINKEDGKLVFTRDGMNADRIIRGPNDELILDLILANNRLMAYTANGLYFSEPVLPEKKKPAASNPISISRKSKSDSSAVKKGKSSKYDDFPFPVTVSGVSSRGAIINSQFVKPGGWFVVEGERFKLLKMYKSALYVQSMEDVIYRIGL